MKTRRELEIEAEIIVLQEEQEQIKSNKFIKCSCCSKKSKINKTIVVDYYYYIRPSGDYWIRSESYNVYCEKCSSWNSVKKHSGTNERIMYDFIQTHFNYFGERLNSHGNQTLEEMRKSN